jgi:REP element-mobilizing transposase RayT
MSYRVSIDKHGLFLTVVGKDRLPVFQTNKIKQITCDAIDEARMSSGFLLLAYVLMPDHLHILTDSPPEALWSRARWWRRAPAEDEPLRVDLDKIVLATVRAPGRRPAN